MIVFTAKRKAFHLFCQHRDRCCHGTRSPESEEQSKQQNDDIWRQQSCQERIHFRISRLFAHKIRHGDITYRYEGTVMERDI